MDVEIFEVVVGVPFVGLTISENAIRQAQAMQKIKTIPTRMIRILLFLFGSIFRDLISDGSLFIIAEMGPFAYHVGVIWIRMRQLFQIIETVIACFFSEMRGHLFAHLALVIDKQIECSFMNFQKAGELT